FDLSCGKPSLEKRLFCRDLSFRRYYGFQFTPPEGGRNVAEIRERLSAHQLFRAHAFDLVCAQHGIEHRLTKFNHPWTNGQVERMNRTIKDATVRRFYYETHENLRTHLATFLDAMPRILEDADNGLPAHLCLALALVYNEVRALERDIKD